jgi:hypothetical protein
MFISGTLAQIAPIPPSSVEGEIAGHPYITGIVIFLLFSGLVLAVKLLLRSFETRVRERFEEAATITNRMEKEVRARFDNISAAEKIQDQRLDEMDEKLHKYEKHVAVGEKEILATNSAIQSLATLMHEHTEREENITWAKIDKLGDSLGEVKIKVASIEAKMPNGELQKLAEAYHQLALRTDQSRDLEEYARLAELDRNTITKARKHVLAKVIPAKKKT